MMRPTKPAAITPVLDLGASTATLGSTRAAAGPVLGAVWTRVPPTFVPPSFVPERVAAEPGGRVPVMVAAAPTRVAADPATGRRCRPSRRYRRGGPREGWACPWARPGRPALRERDWRRRPT